MAYVVHFRCLEFVAQLPNLFVLKYNKICLNYEYVLLRHSLSLLLRSMAVFLIVVVPGSTFDCDTSLST